MDQGPLMDQVLSDDDFAQIEVIVQERRLALERDPACRYLRAHSLRLADTQQALIDETRGLGYKIYIQMSEPEEMQLVANLIRISQAKRVIEIGSLTGYSALTMALALPADGQLIALDINDFALKIGEKYWQKAGVRPKIQFRIGAAAETLRAILEDQGPGSYDLVYIDADKVNYETYYELSLELVGRGGLVVVSNVYYYGMLEEERFQDSWTRALRRLNDKLRDDGRVDLSMLRIGDGLAVIRKR